MSVSAASFPPFNSAMKRRTGRFLSVFSDKTRLVSPLIVNSAACALIAKSARRLLLHQSKSRFLRNTARGRIGVVFSGDAVCEMQHRDVQGELSFDAFFSAGEIFCIVPPLIFSIGCLLGFVIPSASKLFQYSLGSKCLSWMFFSLVSAVGIGGLIRRRQWSRICVENGRAAGVDFIGRIERVEQDVRSSTTIVRALSRQLEKLIIRFRVTKKALKETVTEIRALSKKNSEVTCSLAKQEDILEKELAEIHKVLLAMQDQQQRQLDLILAIGKAGKLIEK